MKLKYSNKTFLQTVYSVSLFDLIRVMVKGLEHEWVKVDMSSYGWTAYRPETCYGCAATNTICELAGKSLTVSNISERHKFFGLRSDKSQRLLHSFESLVDDLRTGSDDFYNCAINNGFPNFAPVPADHEMWRELSNLPILHTDTYKERMYLYLAFADKWEPIIAKEVLADGKTGE
jgi:hypothetical protein